jgi:hypothetical protein
VNHDDLIDDSSVSPEEPLEVRLFGFTFDPVAGLLLAAAMAGVAVWLLSKENARLRSMLAGPQPEPVIEVERRPCGCTEEVNHGAVLQDGEGADASAVDSRSGVGEPGRTG